jgi:tetratricopeptide (TPR) repeat protein
MIELLLQAERALSVGLLDRAETLYRQVATADPRNSIAVVGLARVKLDRGDELAALDLARNALTIDPENVAAQRMIARLEEVIDYRGAAAEAAIAEMDAEAAAGVFGAVRDRAQVAPPDPAEEGAAARGHAQESEHDAAAEAAERDAEAEAAEHVAEQPEPAPNVPDAETVAAESQPRPPDEPESVPEPEAPPERRQRRSLVDWLFRRR